MLSLCTVVASALLAQPAPASPAGWPAEAWTAQTAWETELNAVPDPTVLRGWHDRFCSEPHIAGTPGDERTIERLVDAFEDMGLEVERHDIWVYLSRSISGAATIVGAENIELSITERPLEEDPFTTHPDLPIGFNAYAKSGDVTGNVVYVNHGTKEDYERIDLLGVSLAGKVVLARYGGNYRGYKVKFAEERGAAAVLIYLDPADSGSGRGAPYPEGGWANETSIQRGSIVTKPYPGDPLTPGWAATEDANRRDLKRVDLPKIPVQPIGWSGAQAIMERMTGTELQAAMADAWTGGMPVTYRIEGGDELKVRVQVEQERTIVKTSNVIATLTGTLYPDEIVIAGCHHDAWGFGASDPVSGLICLMETARSFAIAAEAGHRPARTIKFAAWGAEEHGIIGSTEWCEANRDMLSAGGVAYINLDMAAMGPNFGAAGSPLLHAVIEDATRAIAQMDGEPGETVWDRWSEKGSKSNLIRRLGGGSDHVAFLCHLGIPSCGIGARGSEGSAYHSNYDTLTWYRQVVGDDYASARMVSRITNVLLARLAGAPLVPYDPRRMADLTTTVLDEIEARRKVLNVRLNLRGLTNSASGFQRRVTAQWPGVLESVAAGNLTPEALADINQLMREFERTWLDKDGLSERSWYRSLYAATDPNSGYGAWVLPQLRYLIEERRADSQDSLIRRHNRPLTEMSVLLRRIEMMVR